jgi:hypothetical protein
MAEQRSKSAPCSNRDSRTVFLILYKCQEDALPFAQLLCHWLLVMDSQKTERLTFLVHDPTNLFVAGIGKGGASLPGHKKPVGCIEASLTISVPPQSNRHAGR